MLQNCIKLMKITIYHNPHCSKSRESLQLLQEKEISFKTIEYLKKPLNKAELRDLLDKLMLKPSELIRKSEAIYKTTYKNNVLTEEEWIDVMLLHPKLIQRPIIVHGNKAIIGRPIENVIQLLISVDV